MAQYAYGEIHEISLNCNEHTDHQGRLAFPALLQQPLGLFFSDKV